MVYGCLSCCNSVAVVGTYMVICMAADGQPNEPRCTFPMRRLRMCTLRPDCQPKQAPLQLWACTERRWHEWIWRSSGPEMNMRDMQDQAVQNTEATADGLAGKQLGFTWGPPPVKFYHILTHSHASLPSTCMTGLSLIATTLTITCTPHPPHTHLQAK